MCTVRETAPYDITGAGAVDYKFENLKALLEL